MFRLAVLFLLGSGNVPILRQEEVPIRCGTRVSLGVDLGRGRRTSDIAFVAFLEGSFAFELEKDVVGCEGARGSFFGFGC